MPDPSRFRLATLNLLVNTDLLAERVDMAVDELLRLEPDAICFQEIVHGGPFNIVERFADALGWAGAVTGELTRAMQSRLPHGTAIISRASMEASASLPRVTTSEHEVPTSTATLIHEGRSLHLISSHLMWGGDTEQLRQRQALTIDAHARAVIARLPGTTVLLGGDFNAQPASDTNRFFDGSAVLDGRSTLWVDAWDTVGGPANETTSRNDNSFAFSTAKSFGIAHPAMIPARRIDYLKAFGWTYGKNGHPLAFGRWADTEANDGLSISDHYGVWADFLLV